MSKGKILIVEDNKEILYTNKTLLELEDYEVLTATTLESARKQNAENYPDLILLDIMLPDGNGKDFCREIRENNDVSILFLSALNNKQDVLDGLRAGGDDYLPKPYLMDELLLRVNSLMRRRKSVEHTFTCGSLKLYHYSAKAELYDEDLLLKPKEFRVLELLCMNPAKTFSPEEIYLTVWGVTGNGNFQPLYNVISSLKSKLNDFEYAISKISDGYIWVKL